CNFFFQAEDGIRDKLVTGVQTCALPIWLSSADNDCHSRRARTSHGRSHGNRYRPTRALEWVHEKILFICTRGSHDEHRKCFGSRSEERRVGKECISWGRPDAFMTI